MDRGVTVVTMLRLFAAALAVAVALAASAPAFSKATNGKLCVAGTTKSMASRRTPGKC